MRQPDPRVERSAVGPADMVHAEAAPVVSHLYFHLPFCRSRCAYCDFYSEALPARLSGRQVPPMGAPRGGPAFPPPPLVASRYRQALLNELAHWAALLHGGIDTLYVGGGTSTLLPDDLLLPLLEAAGPHLRPGAEVTVEANPGTMDAALLRELQAAGVNRLSLGVQSFSQQLRQNLGRRVGEAEIREALEAIRQAGPANWNLDLVLGIPGQHRRLLQADLEAAVAARPAHISLYDLTYTPRYQAFVERRLGPGACARAQRASEGAYRFAVDRLAAAGYQRYEISNFARPGCECRHNQSYWRGEDYLGLGVSATSTVGLLRWTNLRPAAAYLAAWEAGPRAGTPGPPLAGATGVGVERLNPQLRRYEAAMLGLRTREGVERELLLPILDREQFAMMLQKGLVIEQRGNITLSAGGMDVSNSVLSAILLPPSGFAS